MGNQQKNQIAIFLIRVRKLTSAFPGTTVRPTTNICMGMTMPDTTPATHTLNFLQIVLVLFRERVQALWNHEMIIAFHLFNPAGILYQLSTLLAVRMDFHK